MSGAGDPGDYYRPTRSDGRGLPPLREIVGGELPGCSVDISLNAHQIV